MTAGDRYVLLGLARPRAAWFAELSRWSNAGSIPAEFLKCVSAEELRTRLTTGRPFSAAIVDGSLASVDRDLLALLRDHSCAPIVVDDRRDADGWRALGAAGVLAAGFDARQLLEVLEAVARAVGHPTVVPNDEPAGLASPPGLVIAACGAGGTGASTVASAVAQGFAHEGDDVVLVDLARNAEQAVLHDVRDVVPGLQELVEAHRGGLLSMAEVRRLCFEIVDRRYSLMLGLRRARYWSLLRPRAFEAAFTSLQSTFEVVVCDVTADFESEAEGGSIDVEERNVAGRTAVSRAATVLAVGRSGVKGIHALVRVVGDLATAGVAPERILPVVNLAPRSPRARAEIAAAIEQLTRPVLGGAHPAAVLFLPSRSIETAVRDGVPLPAPLPERTYAAVTTVVERVGRPAATPDVLAPVAPGSLGTLGATS